MGASALSRESRTRTPPRDSLGEGKSAVHSGFDLEREEFLTAPPLFKYGPRLLTLGGIVIACLAVAAGSWRIRDGLRSGYEQYFAASAATALATKENFVQALARLARAAEYLDSAQGSSHQADRFGALLQGLSTQGVALDEQGKALAASDDSPGIGAIAEGVVKTTPVSALPPGGQLVLPAIVAPSDRTLRVPVVQRLARPGQFAYVVFFVDEKSLTGAVRKEFGDEGGWLRIEDASGREVLDMSMPSRRPGVAGKPRDRLTSPDQATQGPRDYNSQRLLVSTTPNSGNEPRVSVGLTEAAAMVGVEKRIISTWVIVGLVVPVLALLGFTGYALKKFSKVETYLRRLARIDVLTGLPNRRSFHGLLKVAVTKAKQQNQTLALLFVDIDNFKYVNDSLGHALGDALLKHVGSVLAKAVREGDVVCRLGGDEFTVIVGDIAGPEEAVVLGNRILERLRQVAQIDGVELRTKASIGIALMPQNTLDEQDLMRYADTAMYSAKNEGKGHCVVYGDSMAAMALAKARTIQELEAGILAEELFLVYQPKFELSSGELVGYEALVRWNHPTRGVVFPGDFISIAEESGLILELGNWVLDRASRQIREWQEEGHGWHRVAVNVSALQMRHDDFVDRVRGALRLNNIPQSLLQLEITESCLAADTDKMKAMVQGLHELGVLVAVDDFGTGYSSLGTLQQFELDMLKVDRSFVSQIHTRQGEDVCRAIITLGHALGMGVIAEGVETLEQARRLAALQCDQVQGYYFAKPLPAHLACKCESVRGLGLRRVV